MIPAPRLDSASPSAHDASSIQEVEVVVVVVEEKRRILERAIEEQSVYLLGCVLRLLRRMNVFERSQARSPGDIAGDVLADACLAVLRSAERFELGRDPLPWIMGYVANVAKRERDRVFKSNRAASQRTEVSASELAGEDQSGQDVLEEHAANLALSIGLLDARRATALETRQALASLLAPLSEDDRTVVVLSVFEGYDSTRLAQHLGTSAPAARKRLQRALDRLRAYIRGHKEQFAWIENLPEMLQLRDAPSAPAPSAARGERGQDEAGPPCHSHSIDPQHIEHDHSPGLSPAPERSISRSPTALQPAPSPIKARSLALHASRDAAPASSDGRREVAARAASSTQQGSAPAARAAEVHGGKTSP